jgi:redox-sensing transcriptional repressor
VSRPAQISPLTLNRLSVYLRCLSELETRGVTTVSSKDLAARFHLSASQIRKDLAQFGEFGVRGVGYDVAQLSSRLRTVMGLETKRRLVVVGMGNLGSAVATHFSANRRSFAVVAGVDSDPEKVGRVFGGFEVRHIDELPGLITGTGAEIGVLAVPAEAAQECYELMVRSGLRAVLNFAPVRLRPIPGLPTKTVDLRIYLEELGYFLEHA